MAKRRWTVVFVPHDAEKSRAIHLSWPALRWIGGSLGVLAPFALVLGYSALTKSIDLTRLERLERRNELLRAELEQSHRLLQALGDTVVAITGRERQVRLLAGLEPTDPDVQLAGIGGPAHAWTEREQILSEGPTGRKALDLRAELDNLIRRANLLASSYAEARDSLSVHSERLARTPSIPPIAPTVGWFSSPFTHARIHPIHHEARPHEGVDVSAPMATPIVAPAAGRVVDVGTKPGYGKVVTLDHGHGIVTRYAHCSKVLVRVGQWVRRNDRIALVGNTGISTAPHLHYEVIVNGRPVNPLNYIFPEAIVD